MTDSWDKLDPEIEEGNMEYKRKICNQKFVNGEKLI